MAKTIEGVPESLTEDEMSEFIRFFDASFTTRTVRAFHLHNGVARADVVERDANGFNARTVSKTVTTVEKDSENGKFTRKELEAHLQKFGFAAKLVRGMTADFSGLHVDVYEQDAEGRNKAANIHGYPVLHVIHVPIWDGGSSNA